jgi:hypothetical protein
MTTKRAITTAAMCLGSAGVGAVLTFSTASSASPARSAAVAHHHYLHGGYILTDGSCPRYTVAVNAEVRARTNSATGHSKFGLCYIK